MKLQNFKKTLFLIAILGFMVFSVPMTIAQDHHEMNEDQCSSPTQTQKVIADPDEDGSNKFSVTTITAEPGTCLKIEFENASPNDEHSFAIDDDESYGFHNYVHLHLMNSSMDPKTINLQMPDDEVTIPYFCNVSDHKEGGMVGQIVVENDSFLPGFTLISVLSTFTAMLLVIPIIQKKRRKSNLN